MQGSAMASSSVGVKVAGGRLGMLRRVSRGQGGLALDDIPALPIYSDILIPHAVSDVEAIATEEVAL